jgi:hypothetical protein
MERLLGSVPLPQRTVMTMSEVALLLGPVVFQDFEVPSGINFGGGQRLALHRLPGGGRVIDTLGRDDAQINFAGIFTGFDATLRARSLDELRVAAIPLPLTWDVFFYTVLISDFHADYRSGCWIPYRVTCTVIQDEASALLQMAASVATAVAADIGVAAGYASTAGVDLSSLQTAFVTTGAATRGTAAYTSAQSYLIDAQSSIDASIGSAGTTLISTDLACATTAQAGTAGLLAASDAAGQLSSLTTASAYIRRAAINLSNAST